MAGARERPLWRISVAPSRGHEIAAAITPAAQMFYDWAGGLVWVAMPLADEPDAAAIRRAVAALGGHATLIRAPAAVRAAVDVFAPEDAASRALGKRVKESFDPRACSIPGGCGRGCEMILIDAQTCRRRPRAGGDPFSAVPRQAAEYGLPALASLGRDDRKYESIVQTSFTLAQLQDPQVATSEKILRACVHCGFCTATCPTYVLLGDELDSPRGRIYLIKEMLEQDRPATREVVKHIDRCLSCLACMTTCPSGVHYMHLVDHAREHIEKTYKRPIVDRALRALLARVLPDVGLFRLAVVAGLIARPFAPVLDLLGLRRVAAMLRLAPRRSRRRRSTASARSIRAEGARRGRVALLSGCINPVLAPSTNEAAIRVLNRHGIEVVVAAGEGCCGSLVHHMGREDEALSQARNNIDAWTREIEGAGLDAILVTVSGCGTTIKDYGFMLRNDPAYADKAARMSRAARDISEYLATLELRASAAPLPLTVAYHAACSLQHGQKIMREPKELLTKVGFVVKDVPEGHLCCGSAGTYNILQPELAEQLRERKIANIEKPQARCDRRRQYRLHHADRGGYRSPGRPYSRIARLGDRGPAPEALAALAQEPGFARRMNWGASGPYRDWQFL